MICLQIKCNHWSGGLSQVISLIKIFFTQKNFIFTCNLIFQGSDNGISDLSQAALEEELRIELGGEDNEHNITMTRATTRMENRFLILRIRLGIIKIILS